MKIRTEGAFIDCVDGDLIWRKKELTQIKFLLESGSARIDQRTALLRSSVPLLYAHWEGFVKTAGLAYVEYVASQRLRLDELAVPFLALAARKVLTEGAASKKIRAHIEVAKLFRSQLAESSALPYKAAITTRANLSSEVLHDIVMTLGLDFTPFATKTQVIDESLLASRNTIAHGEYLLVTEERYEEIRQQVLEMMEEFRNQIQNAAVLKQFRWAPA